MKYENFEKAKSIVDSIDKHNKVLGELTGDNVSVKLLDGQFTIMTIGSWSSCEHSCQNLAENFVQTLIEAYTQKLQSLHAELLEL